MGAFSIELMEEKHQTMKTKQNYIVVIQNNILCWNFLNKREGGVVPSFRYKDESFFLCDFLMK